ncbi:MAG: PilZ domain-containing protein [Acidobacteriia bacterium]|nr:PilZ domain-containing protein [Terriglobia bacterium]
MTTKGSPAAPAAVSKKVLARVATIGLSDSVNTILSDCFRQFGIQTVPIAADAINRLHREKFDACALRLDDGAEPILEAARKSRSNWRMVVYGICHTAQEALRFSRFSVNAVLDLPVERQNALKVVRATHLLVVHEFRRYVRVPIVSEVRVKFDGSEIRGTSLEISAGGMSFSSSKELTTGQNVTVTFELPRMAQVSVRGILCWARASDGSFGVRFDTSDEARFHVRQWIDDFIENS